MEKTVPELMAAISPAEWAQVPDSVLELIWFFLTWYAKLTIKMPSKQTSIFVVFKIPQAICRTFY